MTSTVCFSLVSNTIDQENFTVKITLQLRPTFQIFTQPEFNDRKCASFPGFFTFQFSVCIENTSAKFSWVFSFANFMNLSPFVEKFYVAHNKIFTLQERRWTTSQS